MIFVRDSSAILHSTLYILHLDGQNLAEAALTIGGGTRSREIPNGSRYIRNNVLPLQAKLRQSKTKARYEVLLRVLSPRGVSSGKGNNVILTIFWKSI